MISVLLHAGEGATLDAHVAVPAAIAGAVAVSAVWLPAPRVLAGVRERARLPQPTLLWPVAAAWALILAAQAVGQGDSLHHGELLDGGLAPWAAMALFLAGWQVMIAAMMLPSSLPLMRLFSRTAASQPRANVVRAAFFGGYAMIWTAFGALAFAGDIAVHEAVDRWGWLSDRTYLIGGATLLIAGAFQFSDLKQKCLSECRHPGSFMLHHYRRGIGEGFRIGRMHGLFCLGCCWALMLVAFGLGVANLAWMAVLTALMLFEKTGKGGERAAAPIGYGLMALGVLVLLDPSWLPALVEVS